MLMQKDQTALLIVDVQAKLTPFVLNSEHLVERCEWLMRLAKANEVPIILSEQYPKGLGHTVSQLKNIKPCALVSKEYFSCYRDMAFLKQWQLTDKKQLVIAGIETHVCVLQTALDFKLHADIEVFVVVDAVSARNELDHRYGLKRMKQAGINLVTSEMVFFEWVECAGTPEFKAMSQAYIPRAHK